MAGSSIVMSKVSGFEHLSFNTLVKPCKFALISNAVLVKHVGDITFVSSTRRVAEVTILCPGKAVRIFGLSGGTMHAKAVGP